MPKDKRLYMTFPIDFDEHPKVEPLSDAAFRTFVAMNGYSRRQKLDGRIPTVVARKKWRVRALSELVASHPERPLVMIDGKDYVLRSYEEHQFTTADEEELHEKRSKAGAMGGKAKANAVASAKQLGQQNVAESRSESGVLTDMTYLSESGHQGDAPVGDSDSAIDAVRILAKHVGISDLGAVRAMLEATTEKSVSARGALILAEAIASKAKGEIRDVDAYIAVTCRNSAAEVQRAYFDLDIEGVAS
jgi:hypothetical protein